MTFWPGVTVQLFFLLRQTQLISLFGGWGACSLLAPYCLTEQLAREPKPGLDTCRRSNALPSIPRCAAGSP
jgi:hypothetical protein